MSLANAPSEILRALILAPSHSSFTDPNLALVWPLFVSALPDQPNAAACIFDTDGRLYSRSLGTGRNEVAYGLSFQTRSLIYSAAYQILDNVEKGQLNKVRRQTVVIGVNSYIVDCVMVQGPIISMGQDEKRRAMFSLNLLMTLIEMN